MLGVLLWMIPCRAVCVVQGMQGPDGARGVFVKMYNLYILGNGLMGDSKHGPRDCRRSGAAWGGGGDLSTILCIQYMRRRDVYTTAPRQLR